MFAGRMDDACKAFAFPFRGVKSCREMGCSCMKFQRKLFRNKKGADDSSPCNDCGHDEKRHFKVEKCALDFFSFRCLSLSFFLQ